MPAIREDDLVFPGLDEDTMREVMLRAMAEADAPDEIIYAFLCTDRVVTEDNWVFLDDDELEEWDEAIGDFHWLQETGASAPDLFFDAYFGSQREREERGEFAMSEWICRKCGHRHSAQQWLLTADKKCHGCGALAVTPDTDPTYTETAPTITESVNETFGPTPEAERGGLTLGSEPLPDEEEEDDEEPNEEEEIRQERVKLAEARRKAKPKPKPKKRK